MLFFKVIVFVVLASAEEEALDYGKIYYYRGSSNRGRFTGYSEVYMRTNTRGQILKSSHNTYIDPMVNMTNLGCIHAASKCSWGKESYWITEKRSLNGLLSQFTLKLGGNLPFPDACEDNNGGCQVTCNLKNTRTFCSCPPEYSLNSDLITCSGNSDQQSVIILKKTKEIYNQNFQWQSQTKDSPTNHTWLIVSPLHHRIKLMFTDNSVTSFESLTVFDGDSMYSPLLGHYNTANSSLMEVWSTQNKMVVVLYSLNSYMHFSAQYVAELSVQPDEAFLSLLDNNGSLTSFPFIPMNQDLCVSIIHKEVLEDNMLQMFIQDKEKSSLEMNKKTLRKIQKEEDVWYFDHFEASLDAVYLNQRITLTANFTGQHSAVFSIVGCNSSEDEDRFSTYLGEDAPPNLELSQESVSDDDSVKFCYNGGVAKTVFNNSYECYCPVGFMGRYCEIGCGPNSYGLDCEGACSAFVKGCLMMIFCEPELPCMCAPGLTGERCNIECVPGFYGASCRQRCGHCRHDQCDIYTGHCHHGCLLGFDPPLCQSYNQLHAILPIVDDIGLDMITVSMNLTHIYGQDKTGYYQLQHKEAGTKYWRGGELQELVNGIVTANVTDLKPEVLYNIRVVIFDNSKVTFPEDQFPIVSVLTVCSVPVSDEFHLTSNNITSESFSISWLYALNSSWCSLSGFDVVLQENWKQLHYNISPEKNKIDFSDLYPGQIYFVKICASTRFGNGPYSSLLTVTTTRKAPGKLAMLTVIPREANELLVTWNEPVLEDQKLEKYRLEYKCLRLMACSEPCSYSGGHVEDTNRVQVILLTKLIPYAQYVVRMRIQTNKYLGPYTVVYATTGITNTTATPEPSSTPVMKYSETTITVQWRPPSNCSQISGQLLGYYVEMSLNKSIEYSGSTENTYVTLAQLMPYTRYEVHVFVKTLSGWNPDKPLIITVKTTTDYTEEVQDLTVYKIERGKLGLRWAPPMLSYDKIYMYTITYRQETARVDTNIRKTMYAKYCTAWPQLLCHDLENLAASTTYLIAVQVWDSRLNMDGRAVIVKATTTQGVPDAPAALRVIGHTENSLTLEWEPPYVIRGILRAFFLKVNQTDSMNITDCCTIFLEERIPLRLKDESQFYRHKVMKLIPTSVYSVSLSAMTVARGPSIEYVAITPPKSPSVMQQLIVQPVNSINAQFSVKLQTVGDYPTINRMYLVLIIPPSHKYEAVIWDKEISKKLHEIINGTFYIVGEYDESELQEEKEVFLGTGERSRKGKFGLIHNPVLTFGTYRVGLALILDFLGAKSVAFTASELFQVTKEIHRQK